MPGPDPPETVQQVPTALGLLVLGLPDGAVLAPDPGAVEGSAWFWLPGPGVGVLTVVDGDVSLAGVLDVERSLSDVDVQVVRDAPGEGAGERHLEFLSVPKRTRTFETSAVGHEHPSGSGTAGQRARFRSWQRGSDVVRLGYRIERDTEDVWRTVLDRVLDTARLS